MSISPFVERERSAMTHSVEPLLESWTEPTQLPFSVGITLEEEMASEKVTFGLVVTSTANEPLSGRTPITVGDSLSESELPPGAQDHTQLRRRRVFRNRNNLLCILFITTPVLYLRNN